MSNKGYVIGLFATTCPFPIFGISSSGSGEFCFRFWVFIFYATQSLARCWKNAEDVGACPLIPKKSSSSFWVVEEPSAIRKLISLSAGKLPIPRKFLPGIHDIIGNRG